MIDRSFLEKLEEIAKANQVPFSLIQEPEHGTPLGLMLTDPESGNARGELIDLEKYLPTPIRKRTDQPFIETESFCTYVLDHKGPSTMLTGSPKLGAFVAHIDYHGKRDDAPSWCTHRAHLTLQSDPDWVRWVSGSGKPMAQVEFAEFLEDMDHTIEEPKAASVVEIVLKLQATSEHYFESAIDRDTGSATLNFKERTEQTGGTVKLPTQMQIAVRPYRSAKVVPVLVRLRYRVRDGKVAFTYQLLRADRIEEEAFNEIRERIGSLTGLEPLLTP